MRKISKILIANRGEIAVRIIRTARKMGIATVAVYAANDKNSLHVIEADEARCIGDVELSETYLNIPGLIAAAKETGCDAVHPGYGFLAENPLFVEACETAGLIFIGPQAAVMRIMGNKIQAREFVKKAGVPVTEGLTGNRETLLMAGRKIGFPVLLKAAAGGGGKGMQIVREEKDLKEALESTSRQALAYFGDDTIYIEKYLDEPRHIEFQIMGDTKGNVIHLFERECSIQRRYQKIIEESPSPTLTPDLREQMGAAAVRIGKEIGYTNAGTIEFLVDKNLNFYFLEMNTRIQVEHPVTEMVTGTDIVEEQIRIAEGHPLRLKQKTLVQKGHAIECRIYAEDPEHNFRPSPGKMTLYREPAMDSIRIDKGITENAEISASYDPMICKLVAWGSDREEARLRMLSALGRYVIHGIRTNISYLTKLLTSQAYISNTISTKFCDEHGPEIIEEIRKDHDRIPVHIPVIGFLLYSLGIRNNDPSSTRQTAGIWNTSGFWRNEMKIGIKTGGTEIQVNFERKDDDYSFRIDGEMYAVERINDDHSELSFSVNGTRFTAQVSRDKNETGFISIGGHIFEVQRQDFLPESVTPVRFESTHSSNEVYSPMPGKVIKLFVKKGDEVAKGANLVIIEAMKMENAIISPADGHVDQINVALNDRVDPGIALIVLKKIEDLENNKQE